MTYDLSLVQVCQIPLVLSKIFINRLFMFLQESMGWNINWFNAVYLTDK